jgi:hypothetical protein
VNKECSRFVLLALIGLAALFPSVARSQNLTGIWKGYFTTDDGQHYTLEFQVSQDDKNLVKGVSYSYGTDIKFYGKAAMTGRYALQDKSFTIQETKTIEVKSAGGGTCIMNYRFTYSRSGKEEFLEGSYVGKSEDRMNPANNGNWGDCGGGKVFLRRVATSEFYVEPFLRNKQPGKNNDSAVAKTVPKPNPAKPVTPLPKKPVPATTTHKPVGTTTIAKTRTVDTIQKQTSTVVVDRPVEKPRISVPAVTRSRQNQLVQTLDVSSKEIIVKLYDNGEVDNDTISLYLDGKPLLMNQRLSTIPITTTIKLDEDNTEHTLAMVAENMGRIPPNTSMMVVQDGSKWHKVSITSTEQKNAMVRFRYNPSSE